MSQLRLSWDNYEIPQALQQRRRLRWVFLDPVHRRPRDADLGGDGRRAHPHGQQFMRAVQLLDVEGGLPAPVLGRRVPRRSGGLDAGRLGLLAEDRPIRL